MKRPPLVERARATVAGAAAVDDATGELLHVLAAGRCVTRGAEVGRGVAVGAAWITSALPPGVPLFVLERDERHAALAVDLFADDPDVHILRGALALLGAQAPFDLVHVADGMTGDAVDEVVALMTPRATLVVTAPGEHHAAWVAHPRLAVAAVVAAGTYPVLVAVTRG